MQLKRRLDKLEQRSPVIKGIKPFTQSLEHPGLYYEGVTHGADIGEAWTWEQLATIKDYNIILIEYVDDWR